MIIYSILGIMEFGGHLNVKRRAFFVTALLLPMTCLVAFRADSVGNDTLEYEFSYVHIASYTSFEEFMRYGGHMEMGYTFSSYVFSQMGLDFFNFQALVAFFSFFSFGRFIYKYSPNVSASCFLISTSVLYTSMNIMRMELAVAILLFSIPYIQERDWKRFIIVVIIASCFHKSSILFLIMYPLGTLKYDSRVVSLIILSSMVIAYMGVTFFRFVTSEVGLYENYLNKGYFSEDRSVFAVSVLFVETLLVLLMFKWTRYFDIPQYIENENDTKNYISFAYISRMAFWIVFAFSIIGFSNNMMNRLSGYFSIMTIIMIPYAITCIRSKDIQKTLFFIMSVIYIMERVTIWTLRPGWNHVVPYEWGF